MTIICVAVGNMYVDDDDNDDRLSAVYAYCMREFVCRCSGTILSLAAMGNWHLRTQRLHHTDIIMIYSACSPDRRLY